MTNYLDETLECKDCGKSFVFSAKDQAFFDRQGFTPPKRCKPCREINKQKLANRTPEDERPTNPRPVAREERRSRR
jgi:hypothetical protein